MEDLRAAEELISSRLHGSILTLVFCLLEIMQPFTGGSLVGGTHRSPSGEPWFATLPTDTELLEELSKVGASADLSSHGGSFSLRESPGLCSWQQTRLFQKVIQRSHKQRANLMHCCLSDFAQQQEQVKLALLSSDGPDEVLTGSVLETKARFELFRSLMRSYDILQVQLLGREFLRLKRKAARKNVAPQMLDFMVPVLLQWWRWLTQERADLKGPLELPPLRVFRPRTCTLGLLKPARAGSQRATQLDGERLAADDLIRAILSPAGAISSCNLLAFPWAQLMGAAVEAGISYEALLKDGAARGAQSALLAAQLATKFEVYAAQLGAATAGRSQVADYSPLLSHLKEIGLSVDSLKADADKRIYEALKEHKAKRNAVLELANAMAAEANIAVRRRLQIARTSSVDVCLASLANLD
ncbi:hypothetical protein Efla_002069 [Eimeria flavescens]